MSLQKTKKIVLYSCSAAFALLLTSLGVQSDKEHTLTSVFTDDMTMVNRAHADDSSGGDFSPDADSQGQGEGGPDSGGAPGDYGGGW